jgi:hypothetical protein
MIAYLQAERPLTVTTPLGNDTHHHFLALPR